MKVLNKKILIQEKKRELEKQILDLRMRSNALLKSEYEEKMHKLQEKWAEIETQSENGEVPTRHEIEKMVGLVKDRKKTKSLAEMIRDRQGQEKEQAKAKEFIKRIRKDADERDRQKE